MLNSRHKCVLCLLPVFSLLLLTGCWSRIEVNDRAFVTGVYIDREDGNYEVSLGVPLQSRLAVGGGQTMGMGGGGGNPYAVVSKKAESIPVAIRKIRSDLSREISWGHCRIIIVGRKMAESGIEPILEFVAREPNFHTKAYIMVAPGKGKDITKLTPVFERIPSEVLREFARRGVTLDTSVKDFLEAQATGGDMVASLLTIGEVNMVSEKGKKSTWVGTDGAALFKGSKMIGTFDVKEMRAGLWIRGKMKNSLISLKSPTDGKIISFVILSSKSTVKPVILRDNVRFDVHIEAEDDLMSSESDFDITDPKQIAKIEDMLSRQLRGRIVAALAKTQKLGVDVFGFSRYLDWRYPKVWEGYKENWRSTYKNIEINVTTQVIVKRTGAEKNPVIHQKG